MVRVRVEARLRVEARVRVRARVRVPEAGRAVGGAAARGEEVALPRAPRDGLDGRLVTVSKRIGGVVGGCSKHVAREEEGVGGRRQHVVSGVRMRMHTPTAGTHTHMAARGAWCSKRAPGGRRGGRAAGRWWCSVTRRNGRPRR
eukprot:scaffold43465_cov54-Phaeocystis_antarctica.AAC.4